MKTGYATKEDFIDGSITEARLSEMSIEQKNINKIILDNLISLTEKHLETLKEVGEGSPEFSQEIKRFYGQITQLNNTKDEEKAMQWIKEQNSNFLKVVEGK